MYKVLIVDDEPLVRICMKTYLDWEALGFTIVGEAADGISALQMIGELRPDVVFLDIKMPKMDGLEVLNKIQGRSQLPKIVMLSSFNDFQTVREAFKRNALDYIHKPTMTEESLRDTVLLLAKAIEKQGSQKNGREREKESALQRQRALQELLTGEKLTEKDLRFLMAEYGLFLESTGVAVLHFQLNDYAILAQRYQSQAAQRLKLVVTNLVGETMRSEKHWEILTLRENHYVLLGLEDPSRGEAQIRSAATRIKANVEQYLNADVTMGASTAARTLQIQTCFQEAQVALNNNLFIPESTLLLYAEMRRATPEEIQAEGHVAAAIQYISQHYTESISLDSVAKVVGLNKSYLSRIFKARTGETMSNYINQCRIRKAASLLRKTDRRAYEIAEMVGYNNVEYFNQVFKKLMGVSPKEYR